MYPLFGLGANLAQALAGMVLKVSAAVAPRTRATAQPCRFCAQPIACAFLTPTYAPCHHSSRLASQYFSNQSAPPGVEASVAFSAEVQGLMVVVMAFSAVALVSHAGIDSAHRCGRPVVVLVPKVLPFLALE